MTGFAFQFGSFSVDPAEGHLRDAAGEVKLGATSRRLLRALIGRAGEMVPKSDLVQAVWGNGAVGDNALHVQISQLRRVLGDDAITTRSGQGYRFVAHLRAQPEPHLRAIPARARPAGAASPRPAGAASPRSAGAASPRSAKPPPRRAAPPIFAADDPPLFGREALLRHLLACLRRHRLVTLTGPGGVGKTRLLRQAASRLAADFPDGVLAVDLAPVGDPAILDSLIGARLGVDMTDREAGLVCLAHRTADRRVLLLLDNCECWLEPLSVRIPDMLRAAPGLCIAATSRAAFGCPGEHRLAVPPLALAAAPASDAALRSAPAIALFAASALQADPDFRLADPDLARVGAICERLDCLPLAIGFAATFAPTLGLPVLEQRLAEIIAADASVAADGRHGTLRATFEWGHALLPAPDRMLLRRLAVFAGDFDLEAAETVAADAGLPRSGIASSLSRLCRHAMVLPASAAPRPGYRLLHTTRIFLQEHLARAQEATLIRDRHAAFVQSRLDLAEAEWENTSDAVWLGRHAPFLADLREALDWLEATPGRDVPVIALAGVAWPLWRELSLHVEGRRRLATAMARLSPQGSPLLELRLRQGLGALLLNTAELGACAEQFDRAIALATAIGDRLGLARALVGRAYAAFVLDQLEIAQSFLATADALMADLCCTRSQALAALASFRLLSARHQYDAALTVAENGLRFCRAAGIERARLFLEIHRVEVLLELGRYDEAATCGRAMLDQPQTPALSGLLGSIHGNLMIACIACGKFADGLLHASQALRLLEPNNTQFWLFDHLALRLARIGRLEAASLVAGYADGLCSELGFPRPRTEQVAHNETCALLDARIEPSLNLALRALGRHMPKDRAIALALAE